MSDDKQAHRGSAVSLDPPEIPESQLTRMDPDSILADEADPEGLLGNDSESEAGGAGGGPDRGSKDLTTGRASSKRTSAASAIFSNELEKDDDTHHTKPPKTPEIGTQGIDGFPAALETPWQASFRPQPDAASANKVEQLGEQVKDLTNQLTDLNGKLVQSFERISDLEDDLSDSQERVKAMSAKIDELEKERQEHLAALNTGLLVEKAHVSSEMQRMMDRVIEETAQRGKAESDKERIESELDELSSSLFNEANKMVAVERLARARAEEKTRQMEVTLKDTEGIMLDQQKVLVDLQRQVEEKSGMRGEKGDDRLSIISRDSDAASTHRLKASALVRSASQRTSNQVRHMVLGTPLTAEARVLVNIVPYQEFRAFVAHLRKLRKQLSPFYNYPLPGASGGEAVTSPSHGSPRRPSSPAHSQVGVSQTSMVTYTGVTAYSQGYSNSSNSGSPFAATGLSRHRDYPQLPSTVENMVYLPSQLSLPFIKRSQEEDVDPCLRLDFAPGLNWLSRRQANTAILEGNLVIEPIFPGGKPPDEEALRREHVHLPPAACALCGIPIINVPLPGGSATGTISADQNGQKSLVPSSIATATTSWASSAANSLREVTGTSVGRDPSGTLSTKSSRPSLFSSFRRSAAGNSKSSSTGSISLEPDSPIGHSSSSSSKPPPQSNGDESAAPALEPSPMDAMLPVPTHIFRIQEGATNRYLLCPHHCLSRMRAACQFWGFIRTMERSVVLEGKFATEVPKPAAEEPVRASKATSAAAAASAPAVPREEAVVPAEPTAMVDAPAQVSASLEAAASEAKADGAEADANGEVHDEPKKDVSDEAVEASYTTATNDGNPSQVHGERKDKEAKVPPATTSQDAADSDEEGGFADAISSPKTKAKEVADDAMATANAKEDEEEEEDETETPLASSAADLKEGSGTATAKEASTADAAAAPSEASDDAPAITSPAKDAASQLDSAAAAADKPIVPPPVPRRSAARGSGASSPAPTLPPRRVPRIDSAASPAAASSSAVTSTRTSATKVSLLLGGSDEMNWEDKMWTEITRLKEEMWKARIGLIVESP